MLDSMLSLMAFGANWGLAAAVPLVYTFANKYHPMLCHLAKSVEVAGGRLHVMGLQQGQNTVTTETTEVKGTWSTTNKWWHLWHFEDKFVMLKKHLFLHRAANRLPANATVIFVDAYDVLFQRPLEELLKRYDELSEGHLAKHGHWPVIYGGDLNCWPFPHNARLRVPRRDGTNRSWLHRIPADAALTADYHSTWRYPVDPDGGEITGDQVCREWLARHSDASEAPEKRGASTNRPKRRHFPFLCAGTVIGKAKSLRRLLREMMQLYRKTLEFDDQALIPLVLLRFPHLGFVDKDARLFLGLHGHDEIWDLERPLCRGNYFAASTGAAFEAFSPPRLLGSHQSDVPKLLHFNGNGKRHMWRCVDEFRELGLLSENGECEFFDVDRNAWNTIGIPSEKGLIGAQQRD